MNEPCDDLDSERDIVLCLSGGGFRATFFHLGVLRYLAETKLLGRIGYVFSVSGGSILAGHLGLNWPAYEDVSRFDNAARQLIRFGRSEVRGRTVRKWYLPWRRRTRRYESILDKFYRRGLLRDVKDNSQSRSFYFLATSATSGHACALTSEGTFDFFDPAYEPYSLPDPSVARAVAASSAFPVLFNPLRLEVKKTARGGHPHATAKRGADTIYTESVMDAGVYDNVGVAQVRAAGNLPPTAKFVISNASGSVEWDTRSLVLRTFLGLFSRTWRSTDILMERVSDLSRRLDATESTTQSILARAHAAYGLSIDDLLPTTDPKSPSITIDPAVRDDLASPKEIHRLSIHDWLPATAPGRSSTALDPAVRGAAAAIRTDLDAFSPQEIKALVQSGFETAQMCLGPHVERLRGTLPVVTSPWDPFQTMGFWYSLGVSFAANAWIAIRLPLRSLLRIWKKEQTFVAAEVKISSSGLIQSSRLRLVKPRDVVLTTLMVVAIFLGLVAFLRDPLGLFPARSETTSLRIYLDPGQWRTTGSVQLTPAAFTRLLVEGLERKSAEGSALSVDQVATADDADVVMTDNPSAFALRNWSDLLASPFVDVPTAPPTRTRLAFARLLRLLHWESRLTAEEIHKRSEALGGMVVENLPGLRLMGDMAVFFYNASPLSNEEARIGFEKDVREKMGEALTLSFLKSSDFYRRLQKQPRGQFHPLVLVKGTFTDQADGSLCVESSHVCVASDVIRVAEGGVYVAWVDQVGKAMPRLLGGQCLIVPGWLSWVPRSWRADVRSWPTPRSAVREHWWYLCVPKASQHPVEAANAILGLARDHELRDALEALGYLTK